MRSPRQVESFKLRDGPRSFSWQEGEALHFLDVLLGRAADLPTETVKLSRLRPELVAAGADRLKRAVLGWLIRAGGWRERLYLRRGQRRRGNGFDSALGEGFTLAFGPASRALWVEGFAVLPSLAALSDDSRKPGTQLARIDAWAGEPSAVGDWVFAWLIYERTARWRLPLDARERLRSTLRALSPLVRLMSAPKPDSLGALRATLAQLVLPEHRRVVELAEARLTAAWYERLGEVMALRYDTEAMIAGWSGFSQTLSAWLDCLDAAGSLDLARPVMALYARVLRYRFSGDLATLRGTLESAATVRSVAQRDSFFGAVRGLFEVGLRLYTLRDTLAQERYGDPRFEEAQIYLRDIDATLEASRPRLDALARTFSNVIG